MKNNINKNRTIYISIATILCIILLLIGSKLLNGGTSYSESNNTEENIDKKNAIIINEFLLKTFASSNSYMDYCYKINDEKSLNLISALDVEFKFKQFVKSQFPAIFSITDNNNLKEFNLKKYEKQDNNKKDIRPEELEDFVDIDDLAEKEEGELLENDKVVENKIISKVELPKPENIAALKVDKTKPYILIYHTHGTESYLPKKENSFHVQDRNYNVLLIGDIITNVLEQKGHKLIHIDTYHDIPSYNKSYAKSLNTARNQLDSEKNLKVILDVHRDGIREDASYRDKAIKQSKIKIDGKNVATFSLVVGSASPNYNKVLEFAKYIKAVSDKMYPGLCKGIIIKPMVKFNQFLSDYSALLEVGSNLNTVDEAKESAKVIGEILDVVIESIQE